MPLTDVDAAVAEAERAIKDLRLRAVELHSDVAGKPLDAPEFLPLFEKMVELDRPVYLHPMREATVADYPGEEMSKYRVWTNIGWPYATGLAMTRLVYGGVMEKFPQLRVITHHCGGIIPFVIGRLDWSYDFNEMRMGYRDVYLKDKPIQYYRQFYYDTAVNGNTPALQCGLSLAGIDHMVFATDLPFDTQNGLRLIRDTINSVEAMALSEADKQKIYYANAVRILRLPFGAL
jgi:aminocarboxymuconate-semialdehyde decarboxylase